MNNERLKELINWMLNSGDLGLSAESIIRINLGVGAKGKDSFGKAFYSEPCDPSDFGRCYRLLENFPELKKGMKKFQSKPWKKIMENWDYMVSVYERDVDSGKSEELYKFMTEEVHGK